MIQAQNWLDENCPKEIGSQIKNLYLENKELEGHLNLKDFTNLEKLNCSYNKLTSLDLTGLKQLRTVYCNDNLLNSLDYSSLNPKSLTGLIIDNNNLPEQDLAVFSQFINLEDLRIGNTDKEKIDQGIYNRFSGSLKSLKKLTNLRDLDISNTDVNGSIDLLPESIRRISYSSKERPESKLREIAGQLDSFLRSRNFKKNWKDIHPEFADKFKQNQWEKLGFNFQQTQEWIKAGLRPDDHHFAAHLRAKGYIPQQNLNLEALRKESRNAQEWLEKNYPLDEREWVNWLVIDRRSGLEGDLIVENFPNLEILDCYCNPLSSLTLSNLPNLARVSCPDSTMNQLTINNCPEISNLNVTNNSLASLDFLDSLDPNKLVFLYITNNSFPRKEIDVFSKFINLERFYLANNPFYGNLRSLRNLTKLKKLGTSGTEISGGYEYLPNNCEFTLDLKEKNTDLKPVGLWGSLSKNEENVVTYYDLQYWKEKQPPYKLLKETLEKIDPDQNIWDFLGRRGIFFNVKTCTFEGDLQFLVSSLKAETLLKDQEKKIDYLESRVQELTDLSEQQKNKIVSFFSCLFPEKELLQDLIKIHLEFTRFKKQGLESFGYDEKCEEYEEKERKIKKQLRTKLAKEEMDKIRNVLTNCEELVSQELELEIKLDSKDSLLGEQKNQILQMSNNGEEKEGIVELKSRLNRQEQTQRYQRERKKSLLISRLEGKLEAKQEEVQHWRERSTILILPQSEETWLINQLKERATLNQAEIDQVNSFLKTKRTFLTARQQTIQELKKCFNELEKSFGDKKRAIIGEVGNVVSNTGGAIGVITFGVPKLVGEAILTGNNFSKIKLSNQGSEQFQILMSEENELEQLENTYNSLVNFLNLQNNLVKDRIFNNKYKIYDALIKVGIWKDRKLTPEKMETAVISLSENLDLLKKEQEEELKGLQDKFGKEQINLNFIHKEDLQSQIQIKSIELQQLTNSAKEKLKSNSKFSEAKRQEREEKLESFFKNIPTNQDEFVRGLEDIKEGLSKKLTSGEINNLCQIQKQNQEQQALQIQPTNYGTPGSSNPDK